MSEKKEEPWSEDVKKAVEEIRAKSGIPGMPEQAADSTLIPTTEFEAFRVPGTYIGTDQAYGGTILDRDRLFYSLREPVGKWFITDVARDIWDNGFVIRDVEDLDDEELDRKVQPILEKLMARQQLTRETIFERRYGTAILLLAYTGFDDSWEDPLFELDKNGDPPKKLPNGIRLLQITPYPWSVVDAATLDEDPGSLRFGLPETYTITIGSSHTNINALPSGGMTTDTITVHWTRVIHDAPRLDEHPYEGIAALDVLFDDLVGFRNTRWAEYQTAFRHGSGFPVIKTKGTRKENEAWISAGGIDDLMARSYFVHGEDESLDFKGAQQSALNPTPYNDMYFTVVAAATRIAQDTIKGVSAGRVTGSEVNERQYFRVISLEQNEKEKMLKELIDRLMQTGQIDFDGEYIIDWRSAFEVNPQDKAAMEFMGARTNDLKLAFMTINEVRELNNLPPIEGGDIIMGRAGAVNPFSQMTPSPAEAEPEETEQTQKSLFDKVQEGIA